MGHQTGFIVEGTGAWRAIRALIRASDQIGGLLYADAGARCKKEVEDARSRTLRDEVVLVCHMALKVRRRVPSGFRMLFLGLAASLGAPSNAQTSGGTYSINFYAITSGGSALRGSCFVVSGSVAQVAPGYSSGGIYALYSGYQFPVPVAAAGDEIFFNGFEECGQ